jgi:hypothetical protein
MITSSENATKNDRFLPWFLPLLTAVYLPLSFGAARWLKLVENWSSLGPMDYLCLVLLAIQAGLLATTLWLMIRPQPQPLGESSRPRKRLVAAGFVLGFAGFWLAVRFDGWVSFLAASVSALGFWTGAILVVQACRQTAPPRVPSRSPHP